MRPNWPPDRFPARCVGCVYNGDGEWPVCVKNWDDNDRDKLRLGWDCYVPKGCISIFDERPV